jgi:hypothetical protein
MVSACSSLITSIARSASGSLSAASMRSASRSGSTGSPRTRSARRSGGRLPDPIQGVDDSEHTRGVVKEAFHESEPVARTRKRM